MRRFVLDLRYSGRLLIKNPGFTAAAVITLALGIGANTAIISLADATLLRPLDLAQPERLVVFAWSSAYPDYRQFAERRDIFSGLAAAVGGSRISLGVDGLNELRTAAFVSGNAFDVLGVDMAAGRPLQPADDVPNAPIVGVLGYELWKSQFGGRSEVIGRVVEANSRPVTIVGVARKGFRGTSLFANPQLYLPVTATPRVRTGFFEQVDVLGSNRFVWITAIGRLAEGVTIEQATSAVNTMYRELHPSEKGEKPYSLPPLVPMSTRALGGDAAAVRQFVLLLGAVVGTTLLIGCANLANLLLARSARRRRELSVRLALGAGRWQIVRQMLAESVLIGMIGGAAGIAVAYLALRLLGAYELPGGLRIGGLGLTINGTALAATAALAILTGLIFGAAPAWRASRTDVMVSLRDDLRAAGARGGPRSTLVAAQVALSLVLLAGSGLFLRSLVHVLNVPLGFTVDGVALASVNLGLARFDPVRGQAFYDAALARVKSMPQVQAAAWTTMVPTVGRMTLTAEVEAYRPAEGEDMTFSASQVGPRYFAAVGTRIVEGRAFERTDNPSAPPVVIVNETASRKYWGGHAIGRRLKVAKEWATVVGVVEDTVVGAIREKPTPFVYVPFDQGLDNALFSADNAHLLVRVDGRPESLLPLLSGALRGIDASAPVYDLRTFEDAVRGLVMPQRMGLALMGFFSILALALVSVGIYGVASYVATLRTREIGIRMALGAERRDIARLILTQGARPVAAGIIAGVGLGLWAAQLASAFLYDVEPRDPLTFTVVPVLLATIALGATYLPARRAARIAPTTALRSE
jgi:predicted permease